MPTRFERSLRAHAALLAVSAFLAAHGPAGCAPARESVVQYGGMRAVMREGDVGPRLAIVDAVADPRAHGVGALAGLGGEVTILAGEAWVTRVEDGAPRTTGPAALAGDAATLLALGALSPVDAASVDERLDQAAFEETLAALARARGGDPAARPFLFTVRGRAERLAVHVIAGECAHANPDADALRLVRGDREQPIEVVLVGVYAEGREGVMTHHGSRTHVHALLLEGGARMTAHVDDLVLAPGAVIALPERP
jgi:hypothetical protein